MKRISTSLFLILLAITLFVLHDSGTIDLRSAQERMLYPFKYMSLAAQDPNVGLPVPVEGVRLSEIADTWGAPRPTGRGHNGVDIFAPAGTPIHSATEGFLTRRGESNLGGNHIFITGPGGVRYYYAHLDSFNEELGIGSEVSTTTVIGYVGNTGNARTTPPHLHFGKYDNGAENPFPFLVERE